MKQVPLLLIPLFILLVIVYVEGKVGSLASEIQNIHYTIGYIESEGRFLETQLDEILIRNDLGSLDSSFRYPVSEQSIMWKRVSKERLEFLTGQRVEFSEDVKLFLENPVGN